MYRQLGTLKFFNESRDYGFIVADKDGQDVFYHYDDVAPTGLSREFLKNAKDNYCIRLSFNVLAYYGRYYLSKKAINVELVEVLNEPPVFK